MDTDNPIEEKEEPIHTPESIEPKKRSWLKIIFLTILVLGGIVAGAGYYFYNRAFGPTIQLAEDHIFTIPGNSTIASLGKLLAEEKVISDESSFNWTANQMSFKIKSGKYRIPANTKSNYDLVKVFRNKQLTIKLTFHNFRLKEQLAGHVAKQIEADSLSILALMNDVTYLDEIGYTPENIMTIFIPNTYEVYWNYSAEKLMERMLKEHEKFWSEDRQEKAKALGLSPIDIYTVASIVETESNHKPERPTIAGVYLNRLRKGWHLEADPTVVFATGDFTIKRVLNRHLEVDSPYNTYKYPGIPPGPIYMASANAIDAVLNAQEHDYMFFCAKPQEAGQPATHAFAKTHRAHINNAKRYQRWLNQQGY
ncbi:MAG: endolytic transglycosylase MltG [Aureispira sp.]|nr:endolytic transglycosylase MltG [Aureispira sp.]